MEKRFMSDERTQVMTAAGIVRGYLYDGIYVFKGMPYAVHSDSKNRGYAPLGGA